VREIGKVDGFLANVYFIGDPHSPTIRQEWDKRIRALSEQLGISGLVPYRVVVLLEAAR